MFTEKKSKKIQQELQSASSIIGEGTTFTGYVDTTGNLRLEGKIVGNINCKSKVAMGKSSKIEGDIHSLNAEIGGLVVGKLVVTELLVLKPSAVVNGDIYATNLVIESGATFTGKCKMGQTATQVKIGDKPAVEAEIEHKSKAA